MMATEIDFSRFTLRKDVPAHRQVAAYLKALIALGWLSPGNLVPGASALAYRLKVRPQEARLALDELESRGFLAADGDRWRVVDDHAATGDQRAAGEVCDRMWDLILEGRRVGLSSIEMERMFRSLLGR